MAAIAPIPPNASNNPDNIVQTVAKKNPKTNYGIVYDLGRSFQWISGKHQELQFAGNELSRGLKDAPHGAEVFAKSPKVGRLQS
jgi:hypothetical protein